MTDKSKTNFRIAVFFYTQTGQLLEILKSLTNPLRKMGCEIIFKEIIPEEPFTFPWTSDQFYEIFPESRAEVPLK